MYRKLISAIAGLALVSSAIAADNVFPSSTNPAGKDPSQIDQYVAIIWDDNAYSGLTGTPYENSVWEAAADDEKWANMGRVGGKAPFDHTWSINTALANNGNPDNFKSGDMGMSWAVQTLGAKGGNKVKMTFNVITGQMQTVYGGWNATPDSTQQVGYVGESYKTVDWADPSVTRYAPVCWGREYGNAVLANQNNGTVVMNDATIKADEKIWTDTSKIYAANVPNHWNWEQPNWSQIMYSMTKDAGHEIGNHTIDHMETNSGLPKSVWPNSGEGFDSDPNSGEAYAAWDVIGWDEYAGRKISKQAWGDAIQLGEDMLVDYLGMSTGTDLFGFRAPRLEVNSNLYMALSEKGYTYACGLEDGYELYRDARNTVWPYTTDNGIQNVWTQKNIGEKTTLDSMPSGFWQIPVNAFIVPEDIRPAVWANHKIIVNGEIASGLAEASDTGSYEDWINDGAKVTGFDFNMFILWGLTGDQTLDILKYNLDERMAGNKSPMHVGAHTDYFTPMYDIGTLKSDANKDSYGLCLAKNTFRDRISTMEAFVDYALGKGAKFVTGKELIDACSNLASQAPTPGKTVAINDDFKLEKDADSEADPIIKFDGSNIDVTVAGWTGSNYPFVRWGAYYEVGTFTSLTHVSLTYKTTSAIKISIVLEDESSRDIVLNNLRGSEVQSGLIPTYHFEDMRLEGNTGTALDPAKVIGIEIEPLAPENKDDGTYSERTEPYDISFMIKDFKVYGDQIPDDPIVPITNDIAKAGVTSIKALSSSALKLNIATAGKYNIKVLTANGKVVKEINAADLKAGLKSFNLNNIANGMYMISVKGIDNKVSLVKSAMIL